MNVLSVEDVQRDIVDYMNYLSQEFGIDAGRIEFETNAESDDLNISITLTKSSGSNFC